MSESQTPADAAAVAHGEAALKLLAKGDFSAVSDRFVRKIRPFIPADALKLAWNQITAEAGPFGDIISSKPEPADHPELTLVTITCAFERGQLLACMLVDEEGRFTGLWFHAKL